MATPAALAAARLGRASKVAELAEQVRAAADAGLSMDAASRRARAASMGLDPNIVWHRTDVRGKDQFADARGRMYAAPTSWQARQASQTGGRASYPLLLPKPIFGLHHNPVVDDIFDNDALRGVVWDEIADERGIPIGMHTAYVPGKSSFGANTLERIESVNRQFRNDPSWERAARASLKQANKDFVSHNKPSGGLTAWDFYDPEWGDQSPVAATQPLRQHMDNMGDDGHLAHAMSYDNVDGGLPFILEDSPKRGQFVMHEGTGSLLEALGYAGTLVDDEGGMSVVTFQPHRVRHATKSLLDPAQAHMPGIMRAVIPASAIGAGSAAQQQQPGVLDGLKGR